MECVRNVLAKIQPDCMITAPFSAFSLKPAPVGFKISIHRILPHSESITVKAECVWKTISIQLLYLVLSHFLKQVLNLFKDQL